MSSQATNFGRQVAQSDLVVGAQKLPGELLTGVTSLASNVIMLVTLIFGIIAVVLLSRVDENTTPQNYFTDSSNSTAHITGAVFAGLTFLFAFISYFVFRRGQKCEQRPQPQLVQPQYPLYR